MEEIFNEVKVNEYKIGSLWRSFNGGEVEIVKESNMQAMITVSTRWYPRWLQKLVSTHELRETPWPNFRGGGGILR